MPKRTPATPDPDPRATLVQKKARLLGELHIPGDALPGSLALTHSRCGSPGCHCAQGKGHPGWQLTFMAGGKKRVHRIPAEWAEEVKARVDAGRAFKEAIAELFAANAELLALDRKERRPRQRRTRQDSSDSNDSRR